MKAIGRSTSSEAFIEVLRPTDANPKYIEEGRLVKSARRIYNYRKDIARPEQLQRLREKVDG